MIITDTIVPDTTFKYIVPPNSGLTEFFWRVSAVNENGSSIWSERWNFNLPVCNLQAAYTYIDSGFAKFKFINTSIGSFNKSYWDFGDGTHANTFHAEHVFPYDGTYQVTLSVTDSTTSTLCFDDFSVMIEVDSDTSGNDCQAAFTIYTDSSTDSIFIVNNSTGYNLNYYWDFGDGTNSVLLYPKHHYLTDGPYNFCLDGISSKNGFYIVVLPAPPSGIQDDLISNFRFRIYPNPTEDFLMIEHKYFPAEVIEIYDFVSNLCLQYPVQNSESSYIDIRNLSSGIYFIRIKGNEKFVTGKFIKL